MCGLVFAGGRSSMCLSDVEKFEQMLQCDTYRGEHSTGVASLFKPYGKEATFRLAKAAMDGFDFVKTELWDAVTRMRTASTTGLGGATYATMPKVMFGHNRYATMGAVNAVNAHPFEVDHIILAHNGTLSTGWKSALEDGYKFEVDSHCVAHNVAKIGIAETIQRIRGAFTLIWFNKTEMTLNIIRNEERPFHLWETSIGDWYGCSEEKMGDWLLTRGKVSKTFRRHFECVPGTQYVFDVSDGCMLKEEIIHELPRFRYYHTQQTTTQTYPSRGYSGRSLLEEYDDEAALDEWWNERIMQRQSSSGVRRSEEKEKEGKKKTQETVGNTATSVFEASLKASGHNFSCLDIVKFEMFEYKEYPKKKGFGYIKGQIPESDEFIEVQVHDVKEGEFGPDKLAGCRFVSGYEIHGVKTVIGRPQNDCTLYPLDKCKVQEVDDDQDFSFLEHLDDRDDVVDTRSTMTGETFSQKMWKDSIHNTCSMCSNPIEFNELETAHIENGYCFCSDCVEATNIRKKQTRDADDMEIVYTMKTGQAFTREQWNSRKVKFCQRCTFSLIFEDVPTLSMSEDGHIFCEDCTNKISKNQKEVYCLPCNTYHKENILKGHMTPAEWTELSVACAWKIQYRDKFVSTPKPTREILSIKKISEPVKTEWNYVCTACGQDFPESMMSKEQEDLCSDCYTRFHGATTVRTSFAERLNEKVVWNGMRVTQKMWEKMNGCRCCVRRIPFAMADQIHFMGGAPVCPDCADELGL